MYDLLLRGGVVLDGTGRPRFRADVAVVGDRIAEVGLDLGPAAAVREVPGLIVAPGFIDIHSHSGPALLVEPRPESQISQGVTTEVGGNCGFSFVPWTPEEARRTADEFEERYGRRYEWQTMDQLLALLEQGGLVANFATYIGHGDVRAAAVGWEQRPPTAEEMATMKRLVAEALEAGAWGLSTGLIYPPGCYATTAEIVELSRVVARYGGLYATHLRNESDHLLEAVQEALEIGREAGIPVQISHHKAVGRANWGRVEQSLACLEAARAAGQDVTCDQYPYVATSTSLRTLIPKWAHEGGTEALLARLADSQAVARIQAELRAEYPEEDAWERIFVSEVRGPEGKECEGRSLAEIGALWGEDPLAALIRLLREDRARCSMVNFAMCEEDVERVLQHGTTMVGSDSSARATQGPLRRGRPHPRGFGTFPRVLGVYVRERGVLTLEEAVHKMTGQPAARLGLPGRGTIARGHYADLVVFDPQRVRDRATFAEPYQLAEGIHAVYVNGQLVFQDGRATGALPGRVLRRE
jgi:N-acyl-D-amino-acid deacylase